MVPKPAALAALALAISLLAATRTVDIQPAVETEKLPVDVDDPSIWIHPSDPARSLIVGTVKRPKEEGGGLAVYSLEGNIVQRITGLDRPNNVDILGDICVATERLARQLRVYRVYADAPHLRQIGTIPAFASETGEAGAPMGISLYRRRRDKELFAIVSRKTGPREGYLWQYHISIFGDFVQAERVRQFGAFSGEAEIEAVAVDQDRELVYYSDEDCCVRVYRADPGATNASIEVARFAESGFKANREGIAIAGNVVIVTDQLTPTSEYHVFNRKSLKEIAIWKGQSESTDGLDAIARSMGPKFPKGFVIAMNNRDHNFHLYSWPR